MKPAHPILPRIEAYLKEHNMAASTFGNGAINQPNFVRRLRQGTNPHPPTLKRVEAFLNGEIIKHEQLAETFKRYSEPERVSRDPCWKCGINGEHGCEHQAPGTGRSIYAR